MNGNNWSLFHFPFAQDTAQFGGVGGSNADCTLTSNSGYITQTIFGLILSANYQGTLILNNAELAMTSGANLASQIDNPNGVKFTTASDILDFRYGTEELSSTGGFRGANGNVWIEFGSQFNLQNQAYSSSTANFYVGGNSPSGTGSLVLNNTQQFDLLNGAYVEWH